MKVIIAPDSFKGSLSSYDAARAIERGILKVLPDAETVIVPMADGGEGTVEAVLAAVGGELKRVNVTGPLGNQVEAYYGILPDRTTGIIEMAAASGLPLVPQQDRNPLIATTRGTGELMLHALDAGCRTLIIGLGGSATHDCGMGMAQALGVRFHDQQGNLLGDGGQQLELVASIDVAALDNRINDLKIVIMSDVTNPLCGEEGAAYVYAPQKGADERMVRLLDQGTSHFAEQLKRHLGQDVQHIPGSGAAGGLGAGLMALLGASIQPGIQFMVDITELDRQLTHAAIVFTGEGRTDGQTAFGKVPVGISERAKKHGVPVVCLSGSLDGSIGDLYERGITACFSIVDGPMSLEAAMAQTARLLSDAAENAIRLYGAK